MTTCLFDCNECGLEEARAFVRDQRLSESAMDYVANEVIEAVDVAHSILAPYCSRSALPSITIPCAVQHFVRDRAEVLLWNTLQIDDGRHSTPLPINP